MAALTATHWTISVTGTVIENKRRRTDITLTLASANAAVYPTGGGGIPFPTAFGVYGMVRNLDYIVLVDVGGTVATQQNYVHQYVNAPPGIRLFTQGPTTITGNPGLTELATTIAPAAVNAYVIKAIAYGW